MPDESGVPGLNETLRVWYVDKSGKKVQASGLNDVGVEGFNFAAYVFGWGLGSHSDSTGHRINDGGDAASIREFVATAAAGHLGVYLQPDREALAEGAANNNGEPKCSINGAFTIQYET